LYNPIQFGPTGGVVIGDSANDPGLHNLLIDGTLHVDGVASLASIVCEGTLTAKSSELVFASTDTLDAAECHGTILNNYGQADDTVITLPTIAVGMSFTVLLGTTVAKYYRIKAGTNDKIYLDGTAGSDNGYVGIASAVAGASLMFVAFQTGASAYDWYCSTISGTWTAG
jgi:hypothetical protein